jgi:hypothetical protein
MSGPRTFPLDAERTAIVIPDELLTSSGRGDAQSSTCFCFAIDDSASMQHWAREDPFNARLSATQRIQTDMAQLLVDRKLGENMWIGSWGTCHTVYDGTVPLSSFLKASWGTLFATMATCVLRLIELIPREAQFSKLAIMVLTDGEANDYVQAQQIFEQQIWPKAQARFEQVQILMLGFGEEHNHRQLMSIFRNLKNAKDQRSLDESGLLTYAHVQSYNAPVEALLDWVRGSSRQRPCATLLSQDSEQEALDLGTLLPLDDVNSCVFLSSESLATHDRLQCGNFTCSVQNLPAAPAEEAERIRLVWLQERVRLLSLAALKSIDRGELESILRCLLALQETSRQFVEALCENRTSKMLRELQELTLRQQAGEAGLRGLYKTSLKAWRLARNTQGNEDACRLRDVLKSAIQQVQAKLHGKLSVDQERMLLESSLNQSGGRIRHMLDRTRQMTRQHQFTDLLEHIRQLPIPEEGESDDDDDATSAAQAASTVSLDGPSGRCFVTLLSLEELADGLVFVGSVDDRRPEKFSVNPCLCISAERTRVTPDPMALTPALTNLLKSDRPIRTPSGTLVSCVVGFYPCERTAPVLAAALPIITGHLGLKSVDFSCSAVEGLRMLLVPILSEARHWPTQCSIHLVKTMLAGLHCVAAHLKARPFKNGVAEANIYEKPIPATLILKQLLDGFCAAEASFQSNAVWSQVFQPILLAGMFGYIVDHAFMIRQLLLLTRRRLHRLATSHPQLPDLLLPFFLFAQGPVGGLSEAALGPESLMPLLEGVKNQDWADRSPMMEPLTACQHKVLEWLVGKDLHTLCMIQLHLFGTACDISSETLRYVVVLALQTLSNTQLIRNFDKFTRMPADRFLQMWRKDCISKAGRAKQDYRQAMGKVVQSAILYLTHRGPVLFWPGGLLSTLSGAVDTDQVHFPNDVSLGSIRGEASGMSKEVCLCVTCPCFLRRPPEGMRGHLSRVYALSQGFQIKNYHRLLMEAQQSAEEQHVERHKTFNFVLDYFHDHCAPDLLQTKQAQIFGDWVVLCCSLWFTLSQVYILQVKETLLAPRQGEDTPSTLTLVRECQDEIKAMCHPDHHTPALEELIALVVRLYARIARREHLEKLQTAFDQFVSKPNPQAVVSQVQQYCVAHGMAFDESVVEDITFRLQSESNNPWTKFVC